MKVKKVRWKIASIKYSLCKLTDHMILNKH